MLKSELIMSRKVLRNSPCIVATVRNGWGYFWVGKLPVLAESRDKSIQIFRLFEFCFEADSGTTRPDVANSANERKRPITYQSRLGVAQTPIIPKIVSAINAPWSRERARGCSTM